MSASRERKKRSEVGQQPVSEPKKEKKKLSEGWILAICVVLVVAIVFGGIFGYRAYERGLTVLTAGKHTVKVPEFNYFYYNQVYSINSYASSFGIDTTKSLADQKVTSNGAAFLGYFGYDTSIFEDLTADEDGNYDLSWAQFFANAAKNAALQAYAIYDEAKAAGFVLDEDELADINAEITSIESAAKTNGESADELMSRVYGNGCDLEGYRHYMEVVHTASHYPNTLSYTDEERAARYEQSTEDFDVASFYYYNVTASDFVEADEDGKKAEATDAEKTKAREAAEQMEKEFKTELGEDDTGRVSLYADYTRAAATSTVNEEAATWMFTGAKPGDVKLFSNDENNTYYVVKFLDKEDYQTVNALEIMIPADAEDLAEGEKTAADKVKEIMDSLEKDGSEENFRALLEEYPTENSTGVVENMTRRTMNTVSKEIFDWAGMETRTVGDFKSFETSNGTLILYFTGYAEETRQDLAIDSTLTNEWVEKITEALEANCGYDEDAAMHGNVGIYA